MQPRRGNRYAHHRMLDAGAPGQRKPQIVEVTKTRRYTRRTGEDSTLVYFRPVYTYCTGRESLGASIHCDIADTANWQAVEVTND